MSKVSLIRLHWRLQVHTCTCTAIMCISLSLSPSHLSLSFSYLATTLRQMPVDPNNTDKNAEKIEPMPSLADVRRIITEHCILPLGMREGRGKERKRA